MTQGSGPDEAGFARAAQELARALDDFSAQLDQVLADFRPGKDALARRIGVNKSFISGWLRGHRQLFDTKGRRLVTTRDVEKIVEVTRLRRTDPARARRIEAAGARISALVAELTAARRNRWRSEAARALRAVPAEAPAERDHGDSAAPGPARAAGHDRPETSAPTSAERDRADSPTSASARPDRPAGHDRPQPSAPTSAERGRTDAATPEPAQAGQPTGHVPPGGASAAAEPQPPLPGVLGTHVLDRVETAGTPQGRLTGARRWLIYAAGVVAVVVLAYLRFGVGGDDADAGQNVVVLPSTLCRSWAAMPQQGVEVRPCIAKSDGRVALSTEVRAIDPGNAPGDVTVWVWLMNLDQRLLDGKQYHLTRDESTLGKCSLGITDERVVRCGPFRHEPPGQGRYATAMSVRLQDDIRPPGWDSPAFTGTQSPPLTWP